MGIVNRWTDKTRVVVQMVLLACGLLIIFEARAAIDDNTLASQMGLISTSAAMVILLASVCLSFFVTRAMRKPLLRVSTTLISVIVVCLVGAFVRLVYPNVSIELADLVEPAQGAENMAQIVVGPTGADVRLTGDLKEGAADILEGVLTANPAIDRIHLTSEGGLAEEGQAIADVIAAHRLTTYVPDYCVSACTLAFMGGRERILMDGARLGFHAPYQEGLLGQKFVGDAKEQRVAYIKAGIAVDFVDEALKVAPEDIWIPDRERLLTAHVATGYVDRYRFPDSILDGTADAHGARDVVLRKFPILKRIDVVSSEAVDRISAWYLQAYRHGTSEGKATDGLVNIIGATATLVLARADDATLLDIARFIQTAMAVKQPPGQCEAIGENVDLVGAVMVLEDTDKQADTRAEGLITRALTTGKAGLRVPSTTPVTYVPNSETCASLRSIYRDALRYNDVTFLRRGIQRQMPKSAQLLAPLVAGKR